MDIKSLVTTTRISLPPRIVLHGVHGVGKSTWAAGAPTPIFLQTEDGLGGIEVPKFPVATTLDQVWEYMGLLITEPHEYKTFVLDTVDWMEALVWAQVCTDANVKNIEDLGYGKGYIQAMRHWERFFVGLEKIRARGMAPVILSHNEIKTYAPPDGEPYDRYQIKLHRHAATKLEEWADIVLFANFVIFTSKDKKSNRTQAVGSGERIIHTTSRPAWRAKTRYALPDTLPMEFSILFEEIKK